MKIDDVYEKMVEDGSIDDAAIDRWANFSKRMAIFESIGRSGSISLLKFDGERTRGFFTVMVSGQSLGERNFRQDGESLDLLLDAAIEFYAGEALGIK